MFAPNLKSFYNNNIEMIENTFNTVGHTFQVLYVIKSIEIVYITLGIHLIVSNQMYSPLDRVNN